MYFKCKIPVWLLCFFTLLLLGLRAADVCIFPWEWVFAPLWIPAGWLVFVLVLATLTGGEITARWK